MGPAPARFERVYPIRFSHCDPAGIVFFPQYLVLFNHLLEDWFTHGLGIDYAELIGPRRVGTPTVRLECDFRAISRMGEDVTFSITPECDGDKSRALAIKARKGDERRVSSAGVHQPRHAPRDRHAGGCAVSPARAPRLTVRSLPPPLGEGWGGGKPCSQAAPAGSAPIAAIHK